MTILEKRKKIKKFFFIFIFGLSSCQSPVNIDWEKAQTAEEVKNFKTALFHYENVFKKLGPTKRGLKAIRRAADICYFYLKKFKIAEKYYKTLLIHSESKTEKTMSQRQLATLNFSVFNNYNQAILYYNQLLKIGGKNIDKNIYRLQIARSYFFLNKFYQSKIEIKTIAEEKNGTFLFEAHLILGNIYLVEKKTEKAIEIFLSLIKKFPVKAFKEKIFMVVATSYEELKEFDKAIEVLKSEIVRAEDPQLIQIRIENLIKRKKNLPEGKRFKK